MHLRNNTGQASAGDLQSHMGNGSTLYSVVGLGTRLIIMCVKAKGGQPSMEKHKPVSICGRVAIGGCMFGAC